MRAGLVARFAALALALGAAAAPAGAQDAAPAGDVIGPPQLQDFSLDGNVTRSAEPAPPRQAQTQPQTPPPQQQQQGQAAAAQQRAPAAGESPQTVRQAVRSAPAEPRPAPESESAAAELPSSRAADASSLAGMFDAPTRAEPSPAAFTPRASIPAPPVEESGDASGLLPMPWLLALLAAAAGGAFYFHRQRQSVAFAGGGGELLEPRAEPAPQPLRRVPVAAPPAAAPPVPKGIVSTRLRPWLDIGFEPSRCDFGDHGATIEFDVTVVNSGSGPARDVLVEAAVFNAGPKQAEQIGRFFERPAGQGERIPSIAPLKSIRLRHSVTLTRDQLQLFEAGGRKLFVPLIAFNTLYRHGGGDAQTSAAWLVGRESKGEKMAPFRADQGARRFTGLGARELEMRVRR